MRPMLTVVLVHRDESDRAQLRAALEALPAVQITGERSDLRSGLALAHHARPAILVLELAPPGDDTLNAAAQFKMEHPDCAIFLVTDTLDPDTLLRALRAGAQEVLRHPLDRDGLSQAVGRVGAMNARRRSAHGGRQVLTVFSNKGGSGISTIATNLAVSLRQLTRREVVIADFDDQSGDAAYMLGLSPTRSLGDVLGAMRIDPPTVQDALVKHESGVHVLPQPEHLDRVEGATPVQIGTTLDILAAMFDFVVVDAPHGIHEITLEIFDRSNVVLLVTEPSIPSVRAARRSLETLHRLHFLTAPDRVRLVVNRYGDGSAISLPQIEETLGVPVFGSVSNDDAAVSRAIHLGRPMCGEGAPSRAARDIAALARKLIPAAVVDEHPAAGAAARPFGSHP
jgi:pilus assembly protein CpaE